MADDNKIQFDIELNEGSVDASFDMIDKRAEKSAKTSAIVFEEQFQRQEQELKDSISRIVGSTKDVATKSARESAQAFSEAFKKQESIYAASVKQNIDNAIKAITGSDRLKKSAEESASVFSESFDKGFKMPDLTQVASGYYLIKEAIGLIGDAVNKVVENITEGEKSIRLEQRFEMMAKSAHMASDVFKNELSKSVKGLVDDSELMQLATEAFVRLGNGAEKLPQVLELARKTYKVFGGDVVSNSRLITEAIESGNSKALRSIGLNVDLEAAVKKYAASIGTQSKFLSEQQIEQARMNEILTVGAKKFKEGAVESEGFTEALKRLGVAIGNVAEETNKNLAKSSFTKWLTEQVNIVAEGLGIMNAAFKANETTVDGLKNKLIGMNAQYAEYVRLSKEGVSESVQAFNSQRAEKMKAAIDKYNQTLDTTIKKEKELAAAGGGGGADPKSSKQIEAELEAKRAYTQKILELNNTVNQSQIQLAQDEFNRQKTTENHEILYYQQKKQAIEQFEQQKAALTKFYSDNGIVDADLKNQGVELLEAAHVNRMLQIQATYTQEKKTLLDKELLDVDTFSQGFQDVLDGMNDTLKKSTLSMSQSLKALGSQFMTTFKTQFGNAIFAMAQGTKTGEEALQGMFTSLLNEMGMMMIAQGTGFLIQAAAWAWAGVPQAGNLAAAGTAMIAFGAGLAAISAANGGAASPSSASGGGTSGGGGGVSGGFESSPINQAVKPEDTVAQIPKTELNLTINGNVFDRRGTGLEIAQILEEQFAEQGLVIRGA